MARHVTARELKAMLDDATMPGGRELALIDLREELAYSESHLLHARSLPLSRLELRLAALVPRRATRIVLCDGGEGLAAARGACCSPASAIATSHCSRAGSRPGRRPDSRSSPASTCRARRSANSSSTTAPRPRSRAEELDALMRERRRHGRARQPAVRRISTASRSRPASTCRAPSWCCGSATWRPIPRRSWSSIAPAARAASSARSR